MRRRIIWSLVGVMIAFAIVICLGFTLIVGMLNDMTVQRSVTNRIVSGLDKGEIMSLSDDVNDRFLQLRMIKHRKDDIDTLVIGSSHVMYIPWDSSYYIAAVDGATPSELIGLLDAVYEEGFRPSHIIWCLDHWQLYDEYSLNGDAMILPYSYRYEGKGYTPIVTEMTTYYDRYVNDHVEDEENLTEAIKSGIEGLKRIDTHSCDFEMIEGDGKILRNGRRIAAESTVNDKKRNFEFACEVIDSGSIPYYLRGSSISDAQKERFEGIIEKLQEEDVTVDIYLPSWYPLYYATFILDGNGNSVRQAELYVRDFARERGITVHGSYNPFACGITEDDFMDTFHMYGESGWRNYNTVIDYTREYDEQLTRMVEGVKD